MKGRHRLHYIYETVAYFAGQRYEKERFTGNAELTKYTCVNWAMKPLQQIPLLNMQSFELNC
jgi:hypothetical protein